MKYNREITVERCLNSNSPRRYFGGCDFTAVPTFGSEGTVIDWFPKCCYLDEVITCTKELFFQRINHNLPFELFLMAENFFTWNSRCIFYFVDSRSLFTHAITDVGVFWT